MLFRSLSRMTKSKAGKKSLRHIGIALAVDRDWGLPLFFRLYPTNEHDSKVIKGLLDELFEHIRSCTSDKKGITLVFDKGNNSEELIARLDESRHHFIGSRSPYHHDDLCNIPIEHYGTVTVERGGKRKDIPAYETELELYGASRKVIVTFNKATYQRKSPSRDSPRKYWSAGISGSFSTWR